MRKMIFALCAFFAAFTMDAQVLNIIHTNDTHSHIDPQRSGKYKGMGGVIERAAYIDELRSEAGKRNVLLLSAWDFSQGTSYFPELGGNIEIDVLNSMKYDAVCIGNHEFDNGIDELARRLKNLKAPALCANYDFSATSLKGLTKPYVIVRKAGKKIAIIGLLADVSDVVDSKIAKALTYQEPAPVVNELAEFLKNKKKCDYIICVSHLGYVEDKELASKINNVDLIVGGHSHTLLNNYKTVEDIDGDDVVIVQDWHFGIDVGHLKVKF